ncbi:MAG: class I SAM-dependent methyltransferase [Candidatus Marsarchaeota archaeon]|nr:class I SAM-dependent methyltransferase [Candidatus Marsarchaeota archaeon]
MEKYRTLYREVFQDISDAQANDRAESEASYISRIIQRYQSDKYGKRSRVLNVACGLGRHDKRLRELGYDVYSIDIDRGFIKIARQRNRGFERRYRVGEMARLPYKSLAFDAVLCLYSSFNIPDDPKNKTVLKEFSRITRKNGLLIMDLQTNGVHVGSYATKASGGITKIVKRKVVGNYLIGNESLFINDANGNMKEVASTLAKERLYTVKELDKLCKEAGFDILRHYKAYSNRKFKANDPQLLLVARKR